MGMKNCGSELEAEFRPRFVLAFSKAKGAFHQDTNERCKPIPRSTAVGEGLSERDQCWVRGSKNVEQTSPVMTAPRMSVQTVSMNSLGISRHSLYSDSISALP